MGTERVEIDKLIAEARDLLKFDALTSSDERLSSWYIRAQKLVGRVDKELLGPLQAAFNMGTRAGLPGEDPRSALARVERERAQDGIKKSIGVLDALAREVGRANGTNVEVRVDKRKVFVIHGRNGKARQAIFDLLRSAGLQPLEWAALLRDTGSASPYIGDVLRSGFEQAQAVVALFTGDDEARLRADYRNDTSPSEDKELTPQARPNVLFEAGMALASHPDRTVIVELGPVRPFSDIAGRHVVRLTDATQSRQDLLQRLAAAGCEVTLGGVDWHTAGDFTGCVLPPPGELPVTPRASSAIRDKLLVLLDEVDGLPVGDYAGATSLIRRLKLYLPRAVNGDDPGHISESIETIIFYPMVLVGSVDPATRKEAWERGRRGFCDVVKLVLEAMDLA